MHISGISPSSISRLTPADWERTKTTLDHTSTPYARRNVTTLLSQVQEKFQESYIYYQIPYYQIFNMLYFIFISPVTLRIDISLYFIIIITVIHTIQVTQKKKLSNEPLSTSSICSMLSLGIRGYKTSHYFTILT